MLLLTSGCSHSVIYPMWENIQARNPKVQGKTPEEVGYEFDINRPWPIVLSEMLEAELINISHESKDNNQIFEDTLAYLSKPSNPKPDVLVVQWTELSRLCMFKDHHTEDRKKLDRPYGNMFAAPHWIKLGGRANIAANHFHKIHYYDWDGKKEIIRSAQVRSVDKSVENWSLVNKMFALSHVCKAMDIQLVFLPYKGIEVSKDYGFPILIENTERNYGWFNHLLWEGFDPYEHSHFKDDAHIYTAKCLYDYIKTGKTRYVEYKLYDEEVVVYDYI